MSRDDTSHAACTPTCATVPEEVDAPDRAGRLAVWSPPPDPAGPSAARRSARVVTRAGALARRQLRTWGDRSVRWQVDRQLRFKPADRFGHELPERKEFFRRAWHCVRFNAIDGDYAEFGSHGANTFRMAWHATRLIGADAHLWAFDSFAGLPEGADERDAHPRWTPGSMATSLDEFHRLCRRAGMTSSDYDVVPGYYRDSLAPSAPGPRPTTVAVAYVDCDLYSSTVEVLSFLEPRLRAGSVIGFDDYFCVGPDGPSGERRAAVEHSATSRWRLVPYVQFGWAGMSFVVEPATELAGRAAAG